MKGKSLERISPFHVTIPTKDKGDMFSLVLVSLGPQNSFFFMLNVAFLLLTLDENITIKKWSYDLF